MGTNGAKFAIRISVWSHLLTTNTGFSELSTFSDNTNRQNGQFGCLTGFGRKKQESLKGAIVEFIGSTITATTSTEKGIILHFSSINLNLETVREKEPGRLYPNIFPVRRFDVGGQVDRNLNS